ncbi:shikimate kinase [Sphingopyxis sp.]|uniref:shikimate kinase n=1 Tax=Sphingopyxis sp. TaxID=1908224 RepID=UPI003D6D7D32
MRLVFIHGPAASGKLTVARELAAQTGLPLFHNHLVVDALLAIFPFGSDAFVQLRETMWMDVFRAAAADGRTLIFTFHPEASVAPDFPERVVALVEQAGGQVDFVALTCAREIVEARIDAPLRRASGKFSSVALYRELAAKGAFVYPPLPAARIAVDSGTMRPAEAAERIRAALGLG